MPSLLKSNLQKAVRRRQSAAAFATLKHLLAQDANELLRRLPVIMCEDTLLHPRLFIEVVWLMAAASKGYALTLEDAQILTDCVAACLAAPAQYNLAAEVAAAVSATSDDPLGLAFRLRIAYGGMKSDMAFLGRLQNRAAAGELPLHTEAFESTEFTKIPAFDVDAHLILEAVDFHCFPKMVEATGVAKKAIWFHRSALNMWELGQKKQPLRTKREKPHILCPSTTTKRWKSLWSKPLRALRDGLRLLPPRSQSQNKCALQGL
jgi:hypothetical protein